ncbi:MAG: DUF1801 domain-containing protein [Chloroflexi bacterium]|nr:DUF1801 domain-containing protein [Chloroflexota bacterium]
MIDVEAYLDALPDERRAVLQHLREVIRAAAPEATEAIAYESRPSGPMTGSSSRTPRTAGTSASSRRARR